MKRLTIFGLAALTAGTGTTFAQDLFTGDGQGSPSFFGLDSAAQALGQGPEGRRGRGRHGRKGPRGPGFQGFVLGGESGYGLISIHLRPPKPPREAQDGYGEDTQYPAAPGYGEDTQYAATPEYTDDTQRRPRFEGFVKVNGQRYGVVNLQRERVDSGSYDPATEAQDLTGDAAPTPQRREIARISADLVPMKRRRPGAAADSGDQAGGSWPGSWLNDATGETVDTPTGRIQGSLVAFGPGKPPPPPEGADLGYADGAPAQDATMGRRRRRHRGGGLVFEGQIVTETTSGQVLARMAGPPRGPGRGGRGGRGHRGGEGGGMPPPPTDFPVGGDLY